MLASYFEEQLFETRQLTTVVMLVLLLVEEGACIALFPLVHLLRGRILDITMPSIEIGDDITFLALFCPGFEFLNLLTFTHP